MPFAAFLLSLISLLSLHGIALASKSPDSVRLIVTNFAGAPVMVSWAQPGSSVLVPQISTPLTNTSHTIINSFSTHEFVVNWASPSNAQDPQAAPRFAMGELSENVWVFSHKENGSLWIIQENALSAHDQNFDQALAECKYEISQEIAVDSDEELLISEINRCLKQKIRREFFSLEKKLKNERFLKESLSHKLREYVCRDPNVKTSESVSHGAWHSEDLRRNIKFHTLFDQRGVKIAAVDDFITEEECQILKKRSEGRMTKAAVVGDNGAAQLSVSRKAYAADVNVNRRSNGDVVDPLIALQDRILAFTNYQTNYNLSWEGQESFNVIRYCPNGDEYLPHCDGACDGLPHKHGGRVATMVLYCHVADEGGATTFSNADVTVVPRKYQASFFSYMDENGIMDEGALSEHSGCLISKGEKWITTMWMRKGVSSEDPWSHFDPSGIRYKTSKK